MRQSVSQFVESLYVQYAEPLRMACRKWLGGSSEYREIIEDSIEDTFIQCLLSYETVSSHPNPPGWLRITCENKLKENLKKYLRRNDKIILTGDRLLTDGPRRNPENIVELRETEDELIGQLNEVEAQVYFYRFKCDMKICEVASKLGISQSMVNHHLYSISVKLIRICKKNKI